MNDTTKILTIQDISCYGQCSITVALPVVSAFGIETAVLPSAVLSTHTSGSRLRWLAEQCPMQYPPRGCGHRSRCVSCSI